MLGSGQVREKERRHAVTHTWHIQLIILANLVSFLNTGLYSTMAAPEFPLPVTNFDNSRPWLYPCGASIASMISLTNKTSQQLSPNKNMKRVKTQLRLAHDYFFQNDTGVNEFYSNECMSMGQYTVGWFPSEKCDTNWYRKHIRCLHDVHKAEFILKRIYKRMQLFAITFYLLKNFKLKSEISADLEIYNRNKIINGTYNEILKVQCEVESAMQNLDIQIPAPYKIETVKNSPSWTMSGDLTTMVLQDCGVLKFYRLFMLNGWLKILNNSTNKKNFDTCNAISSQMTRNGRRRMFERPKNTRMSSEKNNSTRKCQVQRNNSPPGGRKNECQRNRLARNKKKTMLKNKRKNSTSQARKNITRPNKRRGQGFRPKTSLRKMNASRTSL